MSTSSADLQQQQQEEHPALALDSVIENVLRFLPQQDVFSCSLVCKRWHAAALVVLCETGVLVCPTLRNAEAWVTRYGACLKALVLVIGSVTVTDAGACPAIAVLSQVTRLELDRVTSKPAVLKAIGESVKELRHLRLDRVCWGPLISTSSRNELATAASQLWPGCRQLTYLQANQCDLFDECVNSLGVHLPHLRTLDLEENSIDDAHSLLPLPKGLTSLILGGNRADLDVSVLLGGGSGGGGSAAAAAAATASGTGGGSAASLQQLCALDIHGLTLRQPHMLTAVTALTWLNVDEVAIPEHSVLLSALPHLRQLRQLNMKCRSRFNPEFQPILHVTSLNFALRPLTHLTALDLDTMYLTDATDQAILVQEQQGYPEPQEPNPHSLRIIHQESKELLALRTQQGARLFDGLSLPKLQILGISRLEWNVCSMHMPFNGSDVQQLVAACPALASLTLNTCLQFSAHGTDLDPLSALAGSLTRLHLSAEESPVQDGHMAAIAKLHSLVDLRIGRVGAAISDKGLMTLTALKALTCLELIHITSPDVSQEMCPGDRDVWSRNYQMGVISLREKQNKHGTVTATVSQQLSELCSRSPQLWREVQQALADQLKAAQQEAKNARKEAAAERKRTAAAQKQARKAQKQAAAAHDQVAALREQLEALQAQLQSQQQSQQQSQDSQGNVVSQQSEPHEMDG